MDTENTFHDQLNTLLENLAGAVEAVAAAKTDLDSAMAAIDRAEQALRADIAHAVRWLNGDTEAMGHGHGPLKPHERQYAAAEIRRMTGLKKLPKVVKVVKE